MYLHHIDCMFFDGSERIRELRRFRRGEPSGMLVAIAGLARVIARTAARIESWARKPETAAFPPQIPAR